MEALTEAGHVEARVRQALAAGEALRFLGGRSKDGLGCRAGAATSVDLSGLAGVVSYEPRELVLVLKPGTPLAAVEELLAAEGQHLPCEIPHWGEGATVGGAVACNLSGPRRFKAGALRDFVLGVQWVNGQGQTVRAGGKVVKNVTGYDLSKALCGSFGTLGPMTEICLKVWPRSETEKTLAVHGAGLDPLRALAGLPYEITGLAHDGATAYIRVEGPAPAVDTQIEALRGKVDGEAEILAAEPSAAWWQAWREAVHFAPSETARRWRFTVPATKGPALLEGLQPFEPLSAGCDWAGALVWALLPATADAAALHRLAADHDGSAWRFGYEGEENTAAFTPLDVGVHRLNQRLKEALDPQGIFDPHRLYPA